MSQAKSAAEETAIMKPADELKFGVPPKIQALLGSIQAMQVDEKGGEFAALRM